MRAALELQARFVGLPVVAAHRLAVRAGGHTGLAVVVTHPLTGQSLQPGGTFNVAMAIQRQMPAGRIGVSAASLLSHSAANPGCLGASSGWR